MSQEVNHNPGAGSGLMLCQFSDGATYSRNVLGFEVEKGYVESFHTPL